MLLSTVNRRPDMKASIFKRHRNYGRSHWIAAYTSRVWSMERYGRWMMYHCQRHIEPPWEYERGGFRRDYQGMTKVF